MATRQDIITAARRYLGVPFVHQGRSRTHGVDCIGLILCAAQDCGLYPGVDYTHYAPAANGTILIEQLNQHLDRVPREERWLADVLVFASTPRLRTSSIPSRHAGFLARDPAGQWTLLHAYNQVRCVIEHRFTEEWRARLYRIYRLRGVTD